MDRLTDPLTVAALERKGLAASRREGRRLQVWLAHPVVGDVVRTGVSALRERALVLSLAEAVEATGARRREDTLLIARWRLAGGGGGPRLLAAGAMAARARGDYVLTERLARVAITEGAGFDARFAAAEAAHFLGRPGQAERELADLAADATSDAQRARVALLRFDNAYLLHGRADLRLIDDTVAAVTHPAWRDQLISRHLYVRGASSGPQATVDAASALVQHPGSGRHTAAHVALSYSLARLGRLDDAWQLLTRLGVGVTIPAADESWERWALYGVGISTLIYAGRLSEAEERLIAAYSQVAAEPTSEARAYVAGWLAVLHLEQGRMRSAYRRASESYALLLQLGRPLLARLGYISAVQALALAGRAGKAAETLAALDTLALPAIVLYETGVLEARAWTAAAAGDLPAARDRLWAAADLGEQIGDLIGAASALHGVARLGRARQVSARLDALAAKVGGNLTAARAAYVNALAAGDSEAFGKVASDFADQGAMLYAAEARAEAAVLLRRGGHTRAAAAAAQEAARLLAECEGAVTPTVQAGTARVRLTPGEIDVALQAAAGRSSRQIAVGMHLSVRTVESRLQRVYEKLGVHGRHGLADALRDQPAHDRIVVS